MVTRPSDGTSGPSLSLSDAELLLMSIEARLWSLDRTPEAAPIIEELEQAVAEIRQGLGNLPADENVARNRQTTRTDTERQMRVVPFQRSALGGKLRERDRPRGSQPRERFPVSRSIPWGKKESGAPLLCNLLLFLRYWGEPYPGDISPGDTSPPPNVDESSDGVMGRTRFRSC